MALSSYTAFVPIPDRSEVTTGLLNTPLTVLQNNIVSLRSSVQSSLISVGGLSSNTLQPESGDTIRGLNGKDVILRSIDSGGAHFNARAFGLIDSGATAANNAALRSALSAARNGRIARVYVPNGTYALSDVELPDQVELEGETRQGVIFDSYATNGALFRTVGTVNVSGANNVRLRNFTIRSKSDASAAIALLYGGENVIENVSILNDGSERFQYGAILDQQIGVEINNLEVEGFTNAAIWAPHTGEFSRYGTTTSPFVTVLDVAHSDFNSAENVARGIILNGGEQVVVRSTNFNGMLVGAEMANVRAYSLLNNYFERTSAMSGTASPAIWLRKNSHGAGAAVAPCKAGNIIGNHIEWASDAITSASQNGATIYVDGHAGPLNIMGNEFMTEAVEAGYLVRVTSAVSALNLQGNFDFNEDHAKNFGHTGVIFDTGITDTASRFDRTEAVYPSQVSRLGFGGRSIWFDSPTLATGKTVERGDLLIAPDGAAAYLSTASGTRGSAGASNVHTTNNSSTVTSVAGGNNGNILAGDWVAIAGAGGPYKVKEQYTLPSDNKITYVMASNVTASVSDVAITFVAPSFITLHSGASFLDGEQNTPSIAFRSEQSLGFYRPFANTIAQSRGTFDLATHGVRLSMRTASSLDSTNLLVNEVALSIHESGASFAVRSNGTIFYFTSSASTKG